MAREYRATVDAGKRHKAIERFVDKWARAEGAWNGLPGSVRDMMRVTADRLHYEWQIIWLEEPSLNDLAALELPVLLLKGNRSIRSMRRVCEILTPVLTNCRYVEIAGAGHMSPFTHASEVLPILKEHLACPIA